MVPFPAELKQSLSVLDKANKNVDRSNHFFLLCTYHKFFMP